VKRLPVALLAVLILAISMIVVGSQAEDHPTKTTFLEWLKPGHPVSLEEKQGRYQLGLYPENIRPLSHSVVEVGRDYVVLRDFPGVTDTVIPVYSIASIKILRIGGKQPN
jgi:hypothetical protein